MKVKVCRKCLVEKILSDFYRHPGMLDGHLNICKACVKKRVRKHRVLNIKSIREYDLRRGRTSARKKNCRMYANNHRQEANERNRKYYLRHRKRILAMERKWDNENKLKRAAQTIAYNAFKKGILKRKPCEKCGTTEAIEMHHEDYTKPLDVVWLCKRHHGETRKKYNEP